MTSAEYILLIEVTIVLGAVVYLIMLRWRL